MSNPTLASITAELEAMETAARGRGSLTCDHLAGRIANIRGELQQIAQAQPPAEAQPVAWQHPDALPSVEPGQYGWFWVAVRRARNGRIYSFPATYLNQFQLSDERGGHVEGAGNRYHHGPIDEEEWTFPATGWHDVREHSEYDQMFSQLLVHEGDELVAWRAVPDYGDAQPPSAPVGVPPALTPEQVHEMAPDGLSWDETGAWAMGYEACRQRALAQQPAAVDIGQFRTAVATHQLACRKTVRDCREGKLPSGNIQIYLGELAEANRLLDLVDSAAQQGGES